MPDLTESGVEQHTLQRAGVSEPAPGAGHRGGLEREPSERAERDDGDRADLDAPRGRRQRLRQRGGRQQAQVETGAEQSHRRQEMREAADGERALHRSPWSPPATIANESVRRYMPFMFMPFIPPAGAAAPMPETGKSIATDPACSKVSVILTV